MSSHCQEQAVMFDCAGERLVGIISMPTEHVDRPATDVGLVVVVGGPQVRTGSHRQFTALCRDAAAGGVASMRFDVRGMGDSSGAPRSFEHIDEDIGAAIGALQAHCPGIRHVVLWGLCDGASASLLYVQARQDRRVAALVLLNPWVRSAESLARTHLKHYYWQRLRQPSFWKKLVMGGVALRSARELWDNHRTARGREADPAVASLSFQERMLRGAEGFDRRFLLVLSGRDYTAKEFIETVAQDPRWRTVLARAGTARLDLPEADHTFSEKPDEAAVTAATLQWLLQCASTEGSA